MAILLSLSASDEQVISGIPESITLSASQPSNIFYTLDGTTPDEESLLFVTNLKLPTDQNTVTVKAIAISNTDSSSVLEVSYSTDVSRLTRTRLTDDEGQSVYPFGAVPIGNLSFDSEGNEAKNSVIDFNDLDLIASTKSKIGESLDKPTIDFINFVLPSEFLSEKRVSSPSDFDFNPRAKYITMDGSTEENRDAQIADIINRPHDSMAMVSSRYEKYRSETQLVTSNAIRPLFSAKTGKMTFYYVDSRDNRWVKSTQSVDYEGANLSERKSSRTSQFVYKWVENRYLTKTY